MSAVHEPRPEKWWVYRGTGKPAKPATFPQAPPWRQFSAEARRARAAQFQVGRREIEMVNAALYLRRPLLITGQPGTGKTTLAHAVAYELALGPVLTWPITSRSTLQEGQYRYDAVARLQDFSLRMLRAGQLPILPATSAGPRPDGPPPEPPDIGQYIRLGSLGTAMIQSVPNRPRVLLIDELDKSDIDLPNDLLHVFEEGEFLIPELARLPDSEDPQMVGLHESDERMPVERGRVRAQEFPLVMMTSNNERDFPPAFLRRCLRLDMQLPDEQRLKDIVVARLGEDPEKPLVAALIGRFRERQADLATDQLLNAVFLAASLTVRGGDLLSGEEQELLKAILRPLTGSDSR